MNPLFQQSQQVQVTIPENIKSLFNAVKGASNPTQALQGMLGNNPVLANVMQMCQGKDPKQVFMRECQRRGIDPQSILSQLGMS